jgi:hypothetical protein
MQCTSVPDVCIYITDRVAGFCHLLVSSVSGCANDALANGIAQVRFLGQRVQQGLVRRSALEICVSEAVNYSTPRPLQLEHQFAATPEVHR